MRIFVIDSEEKRRRLLRFLGLLSLEKPLEVVIQDYDPKRSNRANRRYWKLLEEAAKHTGHDKDELHEFYKEKFLGTRTIEIAGERATVKPSTRRLSSRKFNEYMEQVESHMIENFGIWLE